MLLTSAYNWPEIGLLPRTHPSTLFVEIQYSASFVLLSTLTVPLADIDTMVKPEESYCPEAREDRQSRLAQLLSLTSQPSRSDLVQRMRDMNIMAFVNPKLKDLFSVLEEDFHPLQLCEKVPCLACRRSKLLLTTLVAGATHP